MVMAKDSRENRWEPSKVGFINFWVYENEEYDFYKGNILYRGENGQGKSVSMQSIVPLMLDGNKHPSRIDPFGTGKRRIIDYFMVNDVVDKNKVAYLYLTYQKKESKELITTAIGMKPKDDSTVDFWGFVLKDERIEVDFPLTKSIGFNKDGLEEFVPLSKLELKKLIKTKKNAVYVETQREYAEEVNKHIFKYENVDLFKELTDLLIQIRSPKLSKEQKPNILYDALKKALPELPSSDYTMISNTITDIDDRNRKIENTENDLVLAKELADEYGNYCESVFSHAAYRFVEAVNTEKRLTSIVAKKEEKLVDELATFKKSKERLEVLELEQSAAKNKLDLIETPELRSMNNDKEKKEKELLKKKEDVQKKTSQRDSNESTMNQLKISVKSFEDACFDIERALNNEIADIEHIAEEIQFPENDTYISAVKDNLIHFRRDKGYFTAWTTRLKDHVSKLKNVIALFNEEERLKEMADTKREELRENESEIEEATRVLNSTIKALEYEKMTYKTEFRDWLQENEEFYIVQDKIGELMYIVENIYEDSRMIPSVIESELSALRDALLEPINDLFYNNRADMKNLTDELTELKNDKQRLENVKEIEPKSRRVETVKQREMLLKKNIPFIPFYQAVDFAEGVSAEDKERIESALYDMGVLDALIVPADHYDYVAENDAVLLPKPVNGKAETLDKYLTVVTHDMDVSDNDITAILKSIVVGSVEENTALTMDGKYSIGILRGKAAKQREASFIGEEARRRNREEKIAEVNQQIEEVNERISELTQREVTIRERRALLAKEYESRPIQAKITEMHEQRKQDAYQLNLLEERNEKMKALHQRLSDDYAKQRNERIMQSSFLKGPKDKETIAQIVETAEGEYRDFIQSLANGFHSFETKKVEIEGALERLENIVLANDQICSEIDDLERGIKTVQKEIENIDAILETKGIKKIEKEIEMERKKLAEIVKEIPLKIEEKTNLQNSIANLKSEIERSQREHSFANELLAARREVFENEVRGRGVESLSDIYQLATEKKDQRANVSDAIQKMQESVYDIRSRGLEDYSLTSRESVSGTYTIDLQEFEDKKDIISILKDERKRVNVVLFVKGTKMNPQEFHDHLESQLIQQKLYLKKEEEALIKNVMIQGTGEKIRQLIVKAEKWRDDINHYMKQMNNSIDLRLIWSPISKEDMGREDALSTTRLVELLGRDFDTLKDTDIEALSQHFISKINVAKENLNNKNKKSDAENLEQALKKVLDYRDWYQFKIMYQLPGAREKTLNEDNLPKLSGGEKAMAIYIPLFAAAYSKYSAAGDDAPYIVALDEAYAGVDENNVSEMFGFMEQFGFDYILTSQSLWADFETVPGINIYELSFDKEARFVYAEPWRWNGKRLTLNEEILERNRLTVQDELDFDFDFEPNLKHHRGVDVGKQANN
ncbi:TIGR02680 family protein [Sporosarcina sp. FSL W8-0480]|uniref:TIGR02680 family protein n=1 Tax=Sporosarcina sp. FSL W8-0480 TaxID=2954701 RepID=UPI0030DBF227